MRVAIYFRMGNVVNERDVDIRREKYGEKEYTDYDKGIKSDMQRKMKQCFSGCLDHRKLTGADKIVIRNFSPITGAKKKTVRFMEVLEREK